MKQFDEQLLRLKQCLGLTKDSQVALALGMSKAALSNRKQNGSFPEERVVLLKRQRPDLDVMYVLTGQRWSAGERATEDLMFTAAGFTGDVELAKSAARAAHNHAQALADAANDPQVRELLGILIFCDRPAIERVKTFAAKVMGSEPLEFSKRESPEHQLLSATEQGAPNALLDVARTGTERPPKGGRTLATRRRQSVQSSPVAVTGGPTKGKSKATSASAVLRAKRAQKP